MSLIFIMKSCGGQLAPGVLLHIIAAIGVASVGFSLEQAVIIAVEQVFSYCPLVVLPDKDIFHSYRGERIAQVLRERSQILLCALYI